jgi:ubiquinone/menaquinone biosynthesis C-methylase UbiE
MPAERDIYASHADRYERLIRREDHHGNLSRAIELVIALEGLEVIELGAGTGRLTRTLAPRVRSIRAFDASAHMLAAAGRILRAPGWSNWQTGVADHRRIPAASSSADLVISGWSFSYLAVWGGSNWKPALQEGLNEIRRLLRPGGMALLVESLGTGVEAPHPPGHLVDYLGWLAEAGFESAWVRTDYRFASLEEAVELSTFFFGEEMGEQVRERNWGLLPECTGLYWRRF